MSKQSQQVGRAEFDPVAPLAGGVGPVALGQAKYLDNALLVAFIRLVHIAVFLFIVLAPFSELAVPRVIHAIAVPFIIFHWIVSKDMCFLTRVEMKLTGESKEFTVMHRIMSPIYTIPSKQMEIAVWYCGTTALWLFGLVRLV